MFLFENKYNWLIVYGLDLHSEVKHMPLYFSIMLKLGAFSYFYLFIFSLCALYIWTWQVKCYMHQLLSGLEHCHNRNVLHRDIKGSNLLLDNGGVLKIADFGLASTFDPNHKQPMTSRVVTLWYRPPELLLGATDYGVGVDLWSAGCILAELLAGKPIMPGRTEVGSTMYIQNELLHCYLSCIFRWLVMARWLFLLLMFAAAYILVLFIFGMF